MKHAITALVVALALMAGPANAASVDYDGRKDFQIAKDISNGVLKYTRYTIFDDVGVYVNDGIVTLTGQVTMPFKRDDLTRIARKVDGVREVNNHITVLPVSIGDDELRVAIARAIYRNSALAMYGLGPNPSIHIIVEHSRVTLAGVVNSDVDRRLAENIVRSNFLTFGVTNKLRTDREIEHEVRR